MLYSLSPGRRRGEKSACLECGHMFTTWLNRMLINVPSYDLGDRKSMGIDPSSLRSEKLGKEPTKARPINIFCHALFCVHIEF